MQPGVVGLAGPACGSTVPHSVFPNYRYASRQATGWMERGQPRIHETAVEVIIFAVAAVWPTELDDPAIRSCE